MSQQKDKDDSKKAQAATNLAFTDDEENLAQQEPQIQELSIEQKDIIQVPEHDPLEDSGVFSPNPPSGAAAPISPPQPANDKEKSSDKQSPSRKRISRRSPSLDRLKAGAGALYKNVKEAVKTVLRSSSSSPKKESLSDEAKVVDHLRPPVKEEEVVKKKRNPSMVSMASQQTDTDPELDSGLTEVSTLPESDTFDKSVVPMPSDDSVDNLAERVGEMETDVPEADKSGDTDIETDLPEVDKYKESDDKKDDGKKDDADKSGDNKE